MLQITSERYIQLKYRPKLVREAFRRLAIAPKITKAIKFRRYHLKKMGLCALLINKVSIVNERKKQVYN
jgi:hypothetical protein